VTDAPRRPELRSGRAGDDECGLEHRIYAPPPRKSQELALLRRQRQVERLHRLGARPLFELLQQLDRDHDLGGDLDRQLERYARLDPDLLREIGADRFAPMPLRVVGGGR